MVLSLTYANGTTPRPQGPRIPLPPLPGSLALGRTKDSKTHVDTAFRDRMPMTRFSPSRLLTALLCAGLTLSAQAQDRDVRLPDLGSSANALISPQEAQQYGAAMLRQ